MHLLYPTISQHIIACLFLLSFITKSAMVSAQGISSREEARIDLVQDQYNLTGKGVLTIMMDRGVDYRHPDFIQPNGKTRLAYVYDLYDNTGANDPDNPFGVGTIFDSTEINAALENGGAPLFNDLFGHGTATTGIMAGNGSGVADADKFKGVATKSRIISIVVTKDYVPPFGNSQGQPGQFNPGLLTYGFQFAKLKIEELNLPSVTLLNIGSIGDPTDGSVEVCTYIDDYVANGHPFVCGVGDDGGADNHQIDTLIENETTSFKVNKELPGFLRFVAWYEEGDQIEFTIERPNGQLEGPFTGPPGPNNAADEFLPEINIYHRGANVEFSNSSSNLRQLLIDFSGQTGIYTISINAISINSDGIIDGFLNPARLKNGNGFIDNENPGGNINSYSSCFGTISPGDYVATNKWTDINGVDRMRVGEGMPGELWVGSSIGPTMDERIGIDIVTPGELAASAYGEDSYYASFSFNLLQGGDGFYGIQTAVSAAAPILTGVIALMLEVNPNLTPAKIKEILQQSAREDSFTGSTPNEHWGYGKLDALKAIELTNLTVGVSKIEEQSPDFRIMPNPGRDVVSLEFANMDMTEQVKSVDLFSIKGAKLASLKVSNGNHIDFSSYAKGLYIISINIQGNILSKLFIKL